MGDNTLSWGLYRWIIGGRSEELVFLKDRQQFVGLGRKGAERENGCDPID